MICVYPADCTDFSTNGNGTIEPTSAQVTETLKGTLNLRNGPGRNYKVLVAYKNTLTVQVIAKTSSAWY